ncbi:hypothetical protein ACFFGH_24230 [Lysobacter korlensis]|uniref:Lipoprotein n=1 Tax=Lysobacter korlensis TaxID=553636 RepID=A0ABV6RVE8_9GAMM
MEGARASRPARAADPQNHRWSAAAIGFTLLCAALAACTPQASGDPRSVALDMPDDIPEGSPLADDLPAEDGIIARWVDGRNRFGIVFATSSSCPQVPIAVESLDEVTISVTFVPFETDDPMHGCTADSARTAYLFGTPEGIGPGDVTAVITHDPPGGGGTMRVAIEP